jgi:hypothetical protein
VIDHDGGGVRQPVRLLRRAQVSVTDDRVRKKKKSNAPTRICHEREKERDTLTFRTLSERVSFIHLQKARSSSSSNLFSFCGGGYQTLL